MWGCVCSFSVCAAQTQHTSSAFSTAPAFAPSTHIVPKKCNGKSKEHLITLDHIVAGQN